MADQHRGMNNTVTRSSPADPDTATRPARPETETRWQEAAVVFVLAAVALMLRLWLIPARIMVEGDGVHYAALARTLLQGDIKAFLNPYWSNLWIGTIAVFAWPGGDVVLAGRLASAVTGAALVLPVYAIGRAGMGPRAGALAACLVALHPWLLRFSSLVYSESLFNLLLMTALAAAVYAVRRRSLWWWAALAVLTILGMLTREAAGSVVLLLPVLALLAYRAGTTRRRVAAAMLVFLVALAAGVGTRYIVGRLVFGDWTNSGFGLKGTANLIIGDAFYDSVALETLVRAVDPDDPAGRTKYQALLQDGKAWQYVLSNPAGLVKRVATNVLHAGYSSLQVLTPLPFTSRLALRALLFLVAAFGLWACWRASPDVAAIGLGAFAFTMAPLLLFFIHDRMVLPLAPLFCLALAFALAALTERSEFMQRLAYVLLAALLVVTVRWAQTTATVYDGDPVAQKEAALWLRATQPRDSRLMVYDPFVAFYFYDDNPFPRYAPLPFVQSPAELVTIARRDKADIIVIAEWFTRLGGDGVNALVSPDAPAPPELERIAVFGQSPTHVLVYRLRAP